MTAPQYVKPPVRGGLDATVRVPGSRSITNRALVCAALADGVSALEGLDASDDVTAMITCVGGLGARIEHDPYRRVGRVIGTAGQLVRGPLSLHTAISGTTSRFVLPLAALATGEVHIDAGAPMRSRPMGDGIEVLRSMAVEVDEIGAVGHLPVVVRGHWKGGECEISGDVSSQFLSGLLLAAPATARGLSVTVVGELKSVPYVEMTVAVMEAFGAEVSVDRRGPWTITVEPTGYRPCRYVIEPDASSASYFAAAAVIAGGRVNVEGLNEASIRANARIIVDVLGRMGAELERRGDDTTVRMSVEPRGVDIDLSDMSDQASTLGVVAAFAHGETTVRGIGFIRRKESDRIAATVEGLQRLGIEAREMPDGFVVVGGTGHGATIDT